MAVARQVGADATVSTVGSATSRHGSLDQGVVDDAVVDVELGSLGVGLQVDEEFADALRCLLGPATLRVLELLGLGVAADGALEASERNDLLVLENALQIRDRLLQSHALHSSRHFVTVLEVSSQIGDSCLRRYQNRHRQS